jgi:hypothetical protein
MRPAETLGCTTVFLASLFIRKLPGADQLGILYSFQISGLICRVQTSRQITASVQACLQQVLLMWWWATVALMTALLFNGYNSGEISATYLHYKMKARAGRPFTYSTTQK